MSSKCTNTHTKKHFGLQSGWNHDLNCLTDILHFLNWSLWTEYADVVKDLNFQSMLQNATNTCKESAFCLKEGGSRLNLQHREGSICNTPNGLILAQFATQRWLNLQHTKTYKQPFRFLGGDRGVGTVGGGVGVRGIRGVRVGDCVHTHSSYVISY